MRAQLRQRLVDGEDGQRDELTDGVIQLANGDDDVFVFVDGKLVVDIGGVHGPTEGTVRIDDLSLTQGNVYTLDLFQSERNPTGSNFRIETTLDFADCGSIVDDVPK